jgi:hypothetical protein
VQSPEFKLKHCQKIKKILKNTFREGGREGKSRGNRFKNKNKMLDTNLRTSIIIIILSNTPINRHVIKINQK